MRRFSFTVMASRLALAAASLVLAGAIATSATSVASAEPQHRSYLRVGETGSGAARQITLGLNKSMIIELPREVREVMVSNPAQIDAVLQTSTRAYLIGKAAGEANIFFIDKDGRQVVTLEVTIERDFAALGEFIGRIIPGANVKVDSLNGYIVLTGTVQTPIDATRAGEIATAFVDKGQAAGSSVTNGSSSTDNNTTASTSTTTSGPTEGGQVINMITVEGREQVLLKVSVVEMNRTVIKQLGVDLNAIGNFGSLVAAPFQASIFTPLLFGATPVPQGLIGNSTRNPFPLGNGLPPNTLGGAYTNSGSTIGAILRVLEQNDLAHTLAEPNLTAISGETANFLAGGEFPVPITQDAGINNNITVEFKKFGIGLSFTPVVMTEGRISLKISTEVSELSSEGAVQSAGFTIPALKVRRAETMVELPSGGSIAIAGLISDQSRQALSGYPGLKNLPVIGALFRSRDFQKKETELVVLVTPYVVKPVARSQLAQPDDGFGWASDVNTDLIGQMNRVYGRHPDRAPVGQFDGNVGFIVE